MFIVLEIHIVVVVIASERWRNYPERRNSS
jgi:hypothetical protein